VLNYAITLTIGFLISCSLSAQQTVGLFKYDSTSYDGYTLVSPFTSKHTYLINNCGHEIRKWTSEYQPGAVAYLKPNGNLLRTAHIENQRFDVGGGNGGRLEEFDWMGNLVWFMNLSTDNYSQHHDIELLPDGNILVLMWEFVSRNDAISVGIIDDRVPEGTWQESIWELAPLRDSGAIVVWKWNSLDHVIQNYNSMRANYGTIEDHPELIHINSNLITNNLDMLHFNSIDYNEELDQIMLSCHATSEIYIIDHSTTSSESRGHLGGNSNKGGDLLFRYGNPMAFNSGDETNQVSFQQHDAQWIPTGYPNEGNILFFNNGGDRQYSSIDMFKPVMNLDGTYKRESGQPFGPIKPDWSYTAKNKTDFFSIFISGVQPFENGNFLICEGAKGHIFEINSQKEIVWDYVNPVNGGGPVKQGVNIQGNQVFRSYKYDVNSDAFANKTIVEGKPLELDPLPILCDDTTTTPADTSTTFVDALFENNFDVYPNPSHGLIQIHAKTAIGEIAVFDERGKNVYNANFKGNDGHLDIQNLNNGIYSLHRMSNEGIYVIRIAKME